MTDNQQHNHPDVPGGFGFKLNTLPPKETNLIAGAPTRSVIRATAQISAWMGAAVQASPSHAEPNAEYVSDVLSDILHFSKAGKVNFKKALKRGEFLFNDEKADPDFGGPLAVPDTDRDLDTPTAPEGTGAPERAVIRAAARLSQWTTATIEANPDDRDTNTEYIGNVLAELRHFCEASDLDFDEVLERAKHMCELETNDPS